MGIGGYELATLSIVAIVIAAVVIYPASRICRKAGFSPWLGILAPVPIANVLLLWYVAMTPWRGEESSGGIA